MKPLHTISDWQRAYQDGARPQDLLPALALTIAADDPAWIHRASADDLKAQIDALPARTAATPLWGVPFAVKDNIDVAGWPTTAACPAFTYHPAVSAAVVQRLQAAGAIVVGKTNLDQFATGLVGTRSPYGEVPNSFDPAYVSGGSSSGSASVVARGLVPFALGTDTAGSGRVPAGFNHLVGWKPTPGRVPMAGVLPACRSLDVVSVFALTLADAAEVASVMEEPAAPSCSGWLGKPRLGVPMRPGCDAALGWDRAFDAALARAEALGAELVPVDFEPFFEVARMLYEGPWVAERQLVVQALLDRDPGAMDATVRRVITAGAGYTAADAFRARYRLDELRAQLAPLWSRIDALMVPTAPTCPTRAAVGAEPILRNSELGRYTNFVNLLGLSALALPSQLLPSGPPFGVTFIAAGGADAALVDWGWRWEAAGPAALGALLRDATPEDRAPRRTPAASPALEIAVVGAHLEGMPLHGQITERGCRLVERTRTAAAYRLYALPGTLPPKPGLARAAAGDAGHAIEVEVYAMPAAAVGGFLALIPPPLGLGSVQLADGRWVKGFICEPAGLVGAEDISAFGGWRAYMKSR